MIKIKKLSILVLVLFLAACSEDENVYMDLDNPEIDLLVPSGFPAWNSAALKNKPTKYGAELGEKLFTDKRLSKDNSISCASCHIQASAFADHNPKAVGIEGRIGLRNTPPIQNLLFMKSYNWDGSKLQLENQPIVPIITHEEMNSSILEVIEKISSDIGYKVLFKKVFGDETITPERIYKSIAQYEYTLISADSKYDRVKQDKEKFTILESYGYEVFTQKCISCHSGALFTDQSFRNIGFPVNIDTNEAGRARVTGNLADYMSFRVPSLRNIEYTAPYGSFGQFASLKELLDYMNNGVLEAENLDSFFKDNGNRIPLSEAEKEALVAFMLTLSDENFISS